MTPAFTTTNIPQGLRRNGQGARSGRPTVTRRALGLSPMSAFGGEGNLGLDFGLLRRAHLYPPPQVVGHYQALRVSRKSGVTA